MNLDSIILHISLPSWFCIIHKFDKPAFYVFIQVTDKKTFDRGGQIQGAEAWPQTAALPQLCPRCRANAGLLWMLSMFNFKLLC